MEVLISPKTGLNAALAVLDRRLKSALRAAEELVGQTGSSDPFRGLHLHAQGVAGSFERSLSLPLYAASQQHDLEPSPAFPRLAWLEHAFNLSPFDRETVLLALAPEVDLRYERAYAFLQDDVTQTRPTVDLALNLLCGSAEDKLAQRARFLPGAPLVEHGLLQLLPNPNDEQPGLLAQVIRLDEMVVNLLLSQDVLDARLARFCTLSLPEEEPLTPLLAPDLLRGLARLAGQARETGEGLFLMCFDPLGRDLHAAECRQAAAILAREFDIPLLAADFTQPGLQDAARSQLARLVLRQAHFLGAMLYLQGVDQAVIEAALPLLDQSAAIVLTAGASFKSSMSEPGVQLIPIALHMPDAHERRRLWAMSLANAGIELSDTALYTLAERYRLFGGQIQQAVAETSLSAHWQAALLGQASEAARPSLKALFRAARAESGRDLGELAQKLEPRAAWKDLVLPGTALDMLQDLCARVVHQQRVMVEWGFASKFTSGRGITALFAGPSGTGKTMAAEVIASDLELDLYRIDLSGIVSKYIGETEKNLNRIFTAAEDANAILFFDEADALFGKRSEVRDSHDRYANIEIAYLLQKMEQYDGVAILATNLRQNLDDAFLRRLAYIVNFPFPEEADRCRLWQGIWPAEMQVAEDVDPCQLARQYRLSGGSIKNAALSAAFLAAADGGIVTLAHVVSAVQREYQKIGKAMPAAMPGQEARAQEDEA